MLKSHFICDSLQGKGATDEIEIPHSNIAMLCKTSGSETNQKNKISNKQWIKINQQREEKEIEKTTKPKINHSHSFAQSHSKARAREYPGVDATTNQI